MSSSSLSSFECVAKVDKEVLATLKKDNDASASLVGAIDQGTSSTRFLVFTPQGQILAWAQMEHTQIFPSGADKVGWHEHDALEIWNNTKHCVNRVTEELKRVSGIDLTSETNKLKAVGITNQRETTIGWNARTGVPYHHAIVWDDLRTTGIASQIAAGNIDRFRPQTGLPLASYFAGTKVHWLLHHVPQLQQDLKHSEERAHVRFGTVDTWLAHQLTGSPSSEKAGAGNVGGLFVTDVSNASRWLLMDLQTLKWDWDLVKAICGSDVDVPESALAEICPSSFVFGKCSSNDSIPAALQGVPLASILGDQQAALFGQVAFSPGQAKCTYGTGLFLMMNTGTQQVPSRHGLLTTVAYQLGVGGKVQYALEGSVSHSGSTIQWLRDQVGILQNAAQSETLASQTTENDGLYFVPAFAGLFAPHWRPDARACIVGMTATHTKHHICRAALEAAAYQAREVLEAIYADSQIALTQLKVDGGATQNKLLMQFQADMIDTEVIRPRVMETTACGAAFAAGLAVGVWKNVEELRQLWQPDVRFVPQMAVEKREEFWSKWQLAVTKSLGWALPNGGGGAGLVASTKNGSDGGLLLANALLAGAALLCGFLLGRRSSSSSPSSSSSASSLSL